MEDSFQQTDPIPSIDIDNSPVPGSISKPCRFHRHRSPYRGHCNVLTTQFSSSINADVSPTLILHSTFETVWPYLKSQPWNKIIKKCWNMLYYSLNMLLKPQHWATLKKSDKNINNTRICTFSVIIIVMSYNQLTSVYRHNTKTG